VLLKISLDYTPKELNKVELTVKLWKEDAKVACFFDDLLDK
jgi:hypothetical protein